jgi:hypothetical protein
MNKDKNDREFIESEAGKIFQAIYDDEINIKIESFWDAGMTFKLGDKINKFRGSTTVWNFVDGFSFIINLISKEWPKSDFVKIATKNGWLNAAHRVLTGRDLPIRKGGRKSKQVV